MANGAVDESTINSIILIVRTVMAETRLGSRFWFKAAAARTVARNATFNLMIQGVHHPTH
jgi:hypothetical protein